MSPRLPDGELRGTSLLGELAAGAVDVFLIGALVVSIHHSARVLSERLDAAERRWFA